VIRPRLPRNIHFSSKERPPMPRILPVVLILVATAFQSPALARKWTARYGGFSVEAELVDVRDGNAILKKADGSEVAVPLSKLSLADVRYIDSVIKEAETGLGGNAEGVPTAPSQTPAPSEAKQEPTPKNERAGAPRAIRYRWTEGQTFQYRVKTELQLSGGAETLEGSVHYTVKSVNSDGIAEIAFYEYLTHPARESTGSGFRSGPYRTPPGLPSRYYPGRYSSRVSSNGPEVIQVDRLGRIVSMEGGSHLPLFLGRVAHQPFEPLSPAGDNPWTVAADITLRTKTGDWLDVPGLGASRPLELPGRETSVYTLHNAMDNLLTLQRTYEAASAALVDGKPQIAMSGTGELTFDLRRGLFASSKMMIRVTVHEGAVRVEAPIQVAYQLVSEEEEAQQKADSARLAKEGAELVKEKNRPVTVAELPDLIQDLQSDEARKASTARARLKKQSSQSADPKFATALEKYLQHSNEKVREAAAETLAACATPENLSAVLKLLDSDSTTMQRYAVQALGRIKSPAAIDRLVKLLEAGDTWAASALHDVGPEAEPAVLKLFMQGDGEVRQRALRVLMQVGTQKSLPALEKCKDDADPLTKALINAAIQGIQLQR